MAGSSTQENTTVESVTVDEAKRRLRAPLNWLHAVKAPTWIIEGANSPGRLASAACSRLPLQHQRSSVAALRPYLMRLLPQSRQSIMRHAG